MKATVLELSKTLEHRKTKEAMSADPSNDSSMPGMAIKLGYYYIQLLILRAAVHAQYSHPLTTTNSD